MSVLGDKGVFALEARRLAVTHDAVVDSAHTSALAVGTNGATNPALQVDASTTLSATGIKVKSAAAAAGVALSAISSGTNEALTINAKGSGAITLGSVSTGGVTITQGGLTVSAGATSLAGGARMAAGSIIAGTTVLTTATAGATYGVSQAAAYTITLPATSSMIGMSFRFVLTTADANTVAVAADGAVLIGVIVNDVTSVIPATGTTLRFVTGTAAIGDTIEVTGLSATLISVRAITSTVGGITVT